MNNIINLLKYSTKYSNKQKLVFKILNKIDEYNYDIIFEIDNTILKKVFYNNIITGECYHPNKIKYKIYTKCINFYHTANNIIINNNINRSQFQYKYRGLYKECYKNGWLNELFSNIKFEHINWTKELCNKYSKLYLSRSEFSIKDNKAYQAALRNDWLNEICDHMTVKINQLDYPRIIYAWEFEDNSVYIGLTKNLKNRIYSTNYYDKHAVKIHKTKTNLEPKLILLTDFIPANEAQIKEQDYIDQYLEDGWNILNKCRAGSLGGAYQI